MIGLMFLPIFCWFALKTWEWSSWMSESQRHSVLVKMFFREYQFALPCPLRGVFCNSAIKAAESDHEMVVQTLVQTRQELKDLVSILFTQPLGLPRLVLIDL